MELVVLCVVVGLMINVIVASEFASIAREKGYDGGKYFWYTFLFGILGALMVIALPNRNSDIGILRSDANDSNSNVNYNSSNSNSKIDSSQNIEETTYKAVDQNALMWWYIKDVFRRIFGGRKK